MSDGDQWPHLTDDQRAELTAAWLRDALAANAAAARYEQLRLHLLRHNAPLQLIHAAARARHEENETREMCLDVADRYGRVKDDRRMPCRTPCELGSAIGDDRLDAALQVLEHGCVGATLQAAVARVAAQSCRDAHARRALRRMSMRATRHAGLSWRYLRWALKNDEHDVLRDALVESLARIIAVASEQQGQTERAWFASYGRVTPSQHASVTARTVQQVIVPCAQAVLGRGRTSRSTLPLAPGERLESFEELGD